jgi:hypothetical protein
MKSWDELNLEFLSECIDRIRLRMEEVIGTNGTQSNEPWSAWPEDLDRTHEPRIVQLVERLNLTSFGRNLLLLCVGMELDSRLPHLCAEIQESKELNYPSLSLALRLFPHAHWDALSSNAPLRCYRIINVASGELMTQSRLSVDERIWQHLLGIDQIDHRLRRITERIPSVDDLVQSHQRIASEVTAGLQASRSDQVPIIQLTGASASDQMNLAGAVSQSMGLPLYRMAAFHLPPPGEQLDDLTHLMEREFVLDGTVFLFDSHVDKGNKQEHEQSLARVLNQVPGLLIFANRSRASTGNRKTLLFDVPAPTATEQQALWSRALNLWAPQFIPAEKDWIEQTGKMLTDHFVLDLAQLDSASEQAQGSIATMDAHPPEPKTASYALWDACRSQVRPAIEHIAERLTESAEWSDLVLPLPQLQVLHEVEHHVSHRQTVHGDWGFGGKTGRGRGTTVMFSGPSGTGKTLAAEALATRLRLDLFRVDLGATVSKYIGETEKNLGKIFDAADCGGVALLFDEADALFGKRSEVKDARDRYANIEVSFLLQRLESFAGLVILTTNLRESLDQAFLRRLRFVVEFPFPNDKQREEIWKRALATGAPLGELDYAKMARLSISGGTIRNIVLNAAFCAAAADAPIEMHHLRDAVKLEYAKAQHILTAQDVGDWA